MLSKEECLFERDDSGNLLGKLVVLERLEDKPEVMIRPLPRGKLMSIYNTAKTGKTEEQEQADIDLICEGLIDPLLTKEEVASLKPSYALAITTAILALSLGKEQSEVNTASELVVTEESDLKK